jgi:hypothetical protein
VIDLLIQIAVLLAIGGLFIITGWAVRGIIISLRQQNQPRLNLVLQAIQPWVYKAILAGEKLAVEALDSFDTQLSGADKATVANSIYDALPEFLTVGTISIPINIVKSLITREHFAELVRDAYGSAHAYILRNRDFLIKQVEDVLNEADMGDSQAPPRDPLNDMLHQRSGKIALQ